MLARGTSRVGSRAVVEGLYGAFTTLRGATERGAPHLVALRNGHPLTGEPARAAPRPFSPGSLQTLVPGITERDVCGRAVLAGL